jgi:hypothetical protein
MSIVHMQACMRPASLPGVFLPLSHGDYVFCFLNVWNSVAAEVGDLHDSW